jgi:hypothetical protein
MTSVKPIRLACRLEDIASEHLYFGSRYAFHLCVTSQAYGPAQRERKDGLTISIGSLFEQSFGPADVFIAAFVET